MESSRDSSVWRNLAVTFGGGLAIGAVGMKLTQTALRPAEALPRPESNPFTDRLSLMERRLERVEQMPAPKPAAPVAPVAAAPIDQKVLEAVIAAVDARLHEHAGQVERRLADLEARMAVGNQEERQTIAALRAELQRDLREVRESAARSVSDVQGLRQQNERIVDAVDQRFEDMRQEYSQQVADLRESVSQAFEAQAAAQEQRFGEIQKSMEGRMVTAAAAAAIDRVDAQLAPLRAEIRQKEEELAEMRQRLADSERGVLDVVLAIGAACRQAADRISGPREQPPAALAPAPAPIPVAVVPVIEEPEPEIEAEPEPPHEVAVELAVERTVEPKPVQSVPEFVNGVGRKTSSWRIPLVSSFLVSTGYFVLMHYLSAPLQ